MTAPTTPHVDIHRAGDRMKTRISWLDSKHSFSFGQHYDPDNTHHGVLMVNNDDIVLPGQGFDTHPHRDMEIVTWVLRGSLVHQDSIGHSGVIYPGLAQRMSAGTGILHSEKNDSWRLPGSQHDEHAEPVRFIQMWVLPDEPGIDPGYEQLEIDDELMRGGLVPVASGMPAHRNQSAITIANTGAALHVARLQPGGSVQLPEAPYLHLFIAQGEVSLEGAGILSEGDAVRLTASGGQRLSADAPAEVLVWEMHGRLGG
ncbi:pirin family protein [Rhodococcus daqingensis]|uniref:Pirin family protein n=1 Tax=Rhodococcus daqingensis TaxID=2479363 RepID=A0ABW2RSK4_9NOCA